MRILHVTPAFEPARVYGGPIASICQLCRHLARSGCAVRVLTTDANGPDRVLRVDTARDVILVDGVRVRYCHRVVGHACSPALLQMLPTCVRWADVVHLTAVYSFPTIPTLFVSRVLDKPVVWSPRGALQRWGRSTRPVAKSLLERVCRLAAPRRLVLHVTSEEEARATQERLRGVRVVVIPNGVETPAILRRVARNGHLRLLFLGRLHPIKGIERLLDACVRLDGDCRLPWSLTIAGAGEPMYETSLRARIAKMGLADRVLMVGAVVGDAKTRLFEESDVVVVPSFTESFAMVVAEALAHGVPVIASRGTPWSSLEARGCGLWVDNSPESLVTAIVRMSQMPLQDMGDRGREWMSREFGWAARAREMADLYLDLVNGSVGRSAPAEVGQVCDQPSPSAEGTGA